MPPYPAILQPEPDGSFTVTFPDIPEAITFGLSTAEARLRAVEALEAALSFYVDEGSDLPIPGRHRHRHLALIALPALSEAKLQLYSALKASGLRKAELARRMGISRTNIDRLFDLNRHSRLEQLETAFQALGKKLVISTRDAA